MPQFAGLTVPRFTQGTSASQLLNTGLNAINKGGQDIIQGVGGAEQDLLRKQIGDLQKEEAAVQAQANFEKQFGLTQDKFAQDQAEQARREYTQGAIGQILAAPLEKRAGMLEKLQATGGWSPQAAEHKIIQDALATPKVDYTQPSMYRLGADGSVESYKPRSGSEEEAFAKAGFKYGEYTGPKKDGSGRDKDSYDPNKTWTLNSELATTLDDRLGTKDAANTKRIAEKARVMLKLSTKETDNLISQVVDEGWYKDNDISKSKLVDIIKASGKTPNVSYPVGKDKKGNEQYKKLSHEEFATSLLNPNKELREVPDPHNPKKTLTIIVDVPKDKMVPTDTPLLSDTTRGNILGSVTGPLGNAANKFNQIFQSLDPKMQEALRETGGQVLKKGSTNISPLELPLQLANYLRK